MMYVLAAWTGYRKAEISSLTKRSLKLDATPPTVTVAAAYSKRKRQDTQVFARGGRRVGLRAWLKTKTDLGPDELLFPVSAKIPGSPERRTSKMMKGRTSASCPQRLDCRGGVRRRSVSVVKESRLPMLPE